ncbi:MAG: 30S ribosomal protein S9 [Planctomycetota bacterium]|nr:MAG: 30S ribosomal protein S9 [Planctomycetota bacterium]REJ97066.1 MAG: 30S ribosomal protein S9 [Planctomycetota bacterium]REK20584.1 MAG: 30S ribosomal protein S9 [Planctomycetota bacterium]REK35091.1 MAG: 30S ribosomal protein S9 [Planctomycetota bacterium]
MPDETNETGAPEAETPEVESSEEAAVEPESGAEPHAEEGVEAGETGLDIGSEAVEDEEALRATPLIRGRVDESGVAMGTGRRKTAVARVRVKSGSGQITINDRSVDEYFPIERDRKMILAPLVATDTVNSMDVWVRVNGGGPTGQTGAVVLGIARALQAGNPELHHQLSEGGFLTRDGRMVERKKYGYKKARRSFQFSKR